MKTQFLICTLLFSSIFLQASEPIYRKLQIPVECKTAQRDLFAMWCKAQSLDLADMRSKAAFAAQYKLGALEFAERKKMPSAYDAFLGALMERELLLDHEMQKLHANKGRRALGKPIFWRALDYMEYQRKMTASQTVTLTKDGRSVIAQLVCQHQKPQATLANFARQQQLSSFCVKDIAQLVSGSNTKEQETRLR